MSLPINSVGRIMELPRANPLGSFSTQRDMMDGLFNTLICNQTQDNAAARLAQNFTVWEFDFYSMPKPRGTSRRGVGHAVGHGADHPSKEKAVISGYAGNVSGPICSLIDDWESSRVAEILASDSHGNQINYYWLVKNMMGTLVEEMIANWNTAKTSILDIRINLVHLDENLVSLDSKYSMESCTILRGGSGQTEPIKNKDVSTAAEVTQFGMVLTASGAERASKDMEFTAGNPSAGPAISEDPPLVATFPVLTTINPLHYKRIRKTDGDASPHHKAEPLSTKLPPQGWDDGFFDSCPFLEEKPSPQNADAST